MSSFRYSWQAVERRCWEYFNRILGTIEGLTAYSMRDLPKTLPDANSYIWRFSINGGTKTVMRQTRDQVVNGSWLMDATFEAWGLDDDAMMLVGGMIEESTPVLATDGIPGLARLDAVGFPSREPDMINLGGDDNAGQGTLCVRLTIPMRVAFGNINDDERVV
jgi:hypothetical protein